MKADRVRARSLQPRFERRTFYQVLHFEPRPICEQCRIRPFTIPSPLLLQLWRKRAFQHLDHVLSEHGEELPAVEVAACCDVETICTGVRRNDEVGRACECVPLQEVSHEYSSNIELGARGYMTTLTSRCDASPFSTSPHSSRRTLCSHGQCLPSACRTPSIERNLAQQVVQRNIDQATLHGCF